MLAAHFCILKGLFLLIHVGDKWAGVKNLKLLSMLLTLIEP
ncbi:hypothetical protein [Shewanella sp. KX20019]|nr:hypothetical protein [Shewanella sp. KX20019]